MKQWSEIRRRVLVDGASKREVLRETGMHWTTLDKILSHPKPPGYRRERPHHKPVLGPHVEWLTETLDNDKQMHKKHRHTAKRLLDRLRDERGYTGGYTVVKDFVREYKKTNKEVFVPLVHRPGEAQVDFFEALAKIDGVLTKVHVFCMALPYSDLFFVKAYPKECTEVFWDGHLEAFKFFGGVPWRIAYDNLKIAVKQITGCHRRKLTDGFLELVSHYLFEPYFCNVRRGNEKGVVEGLCKYVRLNTFVPVPQVRDWDELNARLTERCQSESDRKLRGKTVTKGELFQEESSSFLALPDSDFDACKKRNARSNSLSLVRFDKNDYSVPVARQELYDFIVNEIRRLEAIHPHRIRAVRVLLENQRDCVLAFADVLNEKFESLSRKYDVPLYLFWELCKLQRYSPDCQAYHEKAKPLRGVLKHQFYHLQEAVLKAMESIPKASSAVENLHSRLSGYFFLRRQIGHQYLELLRFYLNHTPFLRSAVAERAGKTPAELLTRQQHPHWLEMLGYQRFQAAA